MNTNSTSPHFGATLIETPKSRDIANSLSWAWHHHRETSFRLYIQKVFEFTMVKSPDLIGLFIIELNDYPQPDIPDSGMVTGKWLVNHSGLIFNPPINRPSYPGDPENLSNGFFKHPLIKFIASDDTINITESYSPLLLCYKNGRLINYNNTWTICGLNVTWSSGKHK